MLKGFDPFNLIADESSDTPGSRFSHRLPVKPSEQEHKKLFNLGEQRPKLRQTGWPLELMQGGP